MVNSQCICSTYDHQGVLRAWIPFSLPIRPYLVSSLDGIQCLYRANKSGQHLCVHEQENVTSSKWLYSCWFLQSYFQVLFKTACGILVQFHLAFHPQAFRQSPSGTTILLWQGQLREVICRESLPLDSIMGTKCKLPADKTYIPITALLNPLLSSWSQVGFNQNKFQI